MELKPKLNEDMKQTEKSDAPLLYVKKEIDSDRLKAYSSAHKESAKAAFPVINKMQRSLDGKLDTDPLDILRSLEILDLTKYSRLLNSLHYDMADKDLSSREIITQVFSQMAKLKIEFTAVQNFNKAKFPIALANKEFNIDICRTNKPKAEELLQCHWLKDQLNMHIHGPHNLGKTHFATQIGKKAIELEYSTLFLKARDLFYRLKQMAAKDQDVLKSDLFKRDLLILDDIGREFPSSVTVANLFYTLIDYRLSNGMTTIITSVYQPSDWVRKYEALDDNKAGIIEKVMLQALLVEFDGESFMVETFNKNNPEYSLGE